MYNNVTLLTKFLFGDMVIFHKNVTYVTYNKFILFNKLVLFKTRLCLTDKIVNSNRYNKQVWGSQ